MANCIASCNAYKLNNNNNSKLRGNFHVFSTCTIKVSLMPSKSEKLSVSSFTGSSALRYLSLNQIGWVILIGVCLIATSCYDVQVLLLLTDAAGNSLLIFLWEVLLLNMN